MRQLGVYMNDRKAGVLLELHSGKDYIFCFDESYLASDAPAISATMPKRKEPFESEIRHCLDGGYGALLSGGVLRPSRALT